MSIGRQHPVRNISGWRNRETGFSSAQWPVRRRCWSRALELPIKHPITVPMMAQPDQEIAQLFQGPAHSALTYPALRELLPRLGQAPAAFGRSSASQSWMSSSFRNHPGGRLRVRVGLHLPGLRYQGYREASGGINPAAASGLPLIPAVHSRFL